MFEVSRVGQETTLGKIIALMETAEQAKPPVTRLLERYAGPYIALVLMIAACAWLTTQSSQAMLAVLVASCPCALVLAAPATAIAAIAVAARHGILIKGSAFLEHAAEVTSVVFDKTGTITSGEMSLGPRGSWVAISGRRLKPCGSPRRSVPAAPIRSAGVWRGSRCRRIT